VILLLLSSGLHIGHKIKLPFSGWSCRTERPS
jgi:hypothetical protein